jgi:hypothetical protein
LLDVANQWLLQLCLAQHARVSAEVLCKLMTEYISQAEATAISFEEPRFRIGKSFVPLVCPAFVAWLLLLHNTTQQIVTTRCRSIWGGAGKRYGRLRALFSWKDFNSKEHFLALVQDFRSFVAIDKPFNKDHRIVRQVIAGVENKVNEKDFSIIHINTIDFAVYLIRTSIRCSRPGILLSVNSCVNLNESIH